MPKRKSTREHLLNTGAMIVGESGLRALTIRGLSLRAGTNTGSFVYHFGNREAFLNELLERWYEPLFTGVRTHANIHLPAFEKLEAILEDVMEFLLRHGQFIAQLVLDAWRENGRPSASFQESIRATPSSCWKPYEKPRKKVPCFRETP